MLSRLYHTASSCYISHATTTPQIYTTTLHDALPIWAGGGLLERSASGCRWANPNGIAQTPNGSRYNPPRRTDALTIEFKDRKSTRLNSSHLGISYAVVCLKKENIDYGEVEERER